MKKLQPIRTDQAPAPIGPYSQAMRVPPGAELLFVSGQVPVDPSSGELVTGGIEAETRQVLQNLTAILGEAEHDWSDVVKVNVFLKDMGDFAAFNGVYARFVADVPPARAAVQVAALPLGVSVEIELVSARAALHTTTDVA